MRGLLLPLALTLLAGCGSSWTLRSDDTDGLSLLEGDCDDSKEGGGEIGPDAAEVWYDGIDENCDGLSDYDKDGDGIESPAAPGGTDCWDDPDVVPEGYETLNGFPAMSAAAVYPGPPTPGTTVSTRTARATPTSTRTSTGSTR
jgi:hypothetical protein